MTHHTHTQSFQMLILFVTAFYPLSSGNPCLFAPIHCPSPSVYPHYRSLLPLPCRTRSTFFHLTFSPSHCVSLLLSPIDCPLSSVSVMFCLWQCVSGSRLQCCPLITYHHTDTFKDTRDLILPHGVCSDQCKWVISEEPMLRY